MHQLVVRAEGRRPAEGGVSLGHETDETVRLCPDLEDVLLAAANEYEPGRVRIVTEAPAGVGPEGPPASGTGRVACESRAVS